MTSQTRVYLTIALVLIFTKTNIAQSTDWLWAKRAGGTSHDIGNDIATDACGNVYVTGEFSSDSIVFGNITLTNAGGTDIFVVKYDLSGNVSWAKSTGGKGNACGKHIATDAEGNLYITGEFWSESIIFGNITLVNAGNRDIFVVKYDPSGNAMWAKGAGGKLATRCYGISIDAGGNVLVTGLFYSPDITFGCTTLNNNGDENIFLVKYDSNGDVIWAKSAGGTFVDRGYGIATDAGGNVYITGGFYSSSITFGTTTLTNTDNACSDDIFLVKYDTDGNVLWAKGAGGTSLEAGNSISIDADGNVYVTGYFLSSSIAFDDITLTSANTSFKIFIAKYDTDGNVIWVKNTRGAGGGRGWGISTDVCGSIYVTGYFRSPSITFDDITLSSANTSTNFFIAKYDAGGNVIWAQGAGEHGSTGYNICTDHRGNVYLTGYFEDTSIFGNNSLTSTGSYDFFMAKLFSCSPLALVNSTIPDNAPNTDSTKNNPNTNTANDNHDTTIYSTITITTEFDNAPFQTDSIFRELDSGTNQVLSEDSGYTAQGNITIDYDNSGGVEATIISADFEIFPNPFHDKIYIKSEGASEIVIYDITSRKVLQQRFLNTTTLNMGGVANGLYVYELNTQGTIVKGKLVKE